MSDTPDRAPEQDKKGGNTLIYIVAVLLIGKKVVEELKRVPLPGMEQAANEVVLDTGLTETNQHQWHRPPEGSDVFPVALFRALHDPKTGKSLIEYLKTF